jgi:hypothetical protein
MEAALAHWLGNLAGVCQPRLPSKYGNLQYVILDRTESVTHPTTPLLLLHTDMLLRIRIAPGLSADGQMVQALVQVGVLLDRG